jgi:antitoxin (DNA-binding transcriptional repressor) of toxin-antitoxin stability system
MNIYTVKDAQEHLQELMEEARQGKSVVILDEEQRAVQLVPVEQRKARKAGSARGQIHIADDFDAPLDDFAEYMA